MKKLMSVVSTVAKDITTTPAGDYDPARVIGYGTVLLGALVFYFAILWQMFTKGEFNGSEFAVGMVSISGAIAAAAGGVLLKRRDEVPYSEESKVPLEVTGTQAADEPKAS